MGNLRPMVEQMVSGTASAHRAWFQAPSGGGVMRRVQVLGVLAAAAAALVVLAMVLGGTSADGPRRIEIVAKNMVFNGDNPTFRVSPGETVEFHLVNRDPGMIHDLAIPPMGLTTGAVPAGQDATLVVTFPEQPGGLEYHCSYHPITMRGVIQVQ